MLLFSSPVLATRIYPVFYCLICWLYAHTSITEWCTFVDFAKSLWSSWSPSSKIGSVCIVLRDLLYLHYVLQIESTLCMSVHIHQMYSLSNMEFPKIVFLDHYAFQFTSRTSLYSSKHVVNILLVTQQFTAVTLISKGNGNAAVLFTLHFLHTFHINFVIEI